MRGIASLVVLTGAMATALPAMAADTLKFGPVRLPFAFRDIPIRAQASAMARLDSSGGQMNSAGTLEISARKSELLADGMKILEGFLPYTFRVNGLLSICLRRISNLDIRIVDAQAEVSADASIMTRACPEEIPDADQGEQIHLRVLAAADGSDAHRLRLKASNATLEFQHLNLLLKPLAASLVRTGTSSFFARRDACLTIVAPSATPVADCDHRLEFDGLDAAITGANFSSQNDGISFNVRFDAHMNPAKLTGSIQKLLDARFLDVKRSP